MQAKIIGVKELIQNLKKIYKKVDQGDEFIVVKNSKPAFRIVPAIKPAIKERKYTLKDFKKLQFSGIENLSENIDKVVYLS